jgi:hypothetical protein
VNYGLGGGERGDDAVDRDHGGSGGVERIEGYAIDGVYDPVA